jgi:hypothetical protein
MKFHKDRDNRSYPMRPLQREEPLSQVDGIAGDSPMIAACYEAHLSMEKMLAVLAELRGDDAGDAIP